MSELQQYSGASLGRGVSRPVGRALNRLEGATTVAVARIAAAADVQAAKVDTAAAVTQRALQGVAYLTNVEMTLAEATPAAMSRLKLIGDTGAMTLQQITLDTAAVLRRI